MSDEIERMAFLRQSWRWTISTKGQSRNLRDAGSGSTPEDEDIPARPSLLDLLGLQVATDGSVFQV